MEAEMKLDVERLRKLRESRGWSQEQLASAAGLSVRTVQRAEADGTSSRETKVCLAAALGVPHADLEAQAPVTSTPARLPPGLNVVELVHKILGGTFLFVGLGLIGGSALVKHSPVLTYLGALFTLGGVVELILAHMARRSAGKHDGQER
jgi:transcriptional regulator with XRE-family HTH domain